MQTFDPTADSDALRAAFGRFTTGVTIVTVDTPTGPLGMTANSFTSVSLSPPMILWCPATASLRHNAFAQAKRFALHILSSEQEHLAREFAKAGAAFHHCDWDQDATGLPLINDCSARLVCRTETRIGAGDHTIIVAHVEQAASSGKPALAFSDGKYGTFTES